MFTQRFVLFSRFVFFSKRCCAFFLDRTFFPPSMILFSFFFCSTFLCFCFDVRFCHSVLVTKWLHRDFFPSGFFTGRISTSKLWTAPACPSLPWFRLFGTSFFFLRFPRRHLDPHFSLKVFQVVRSFFFPGKVWRFGYLRIILSCSTLPISAPYTRFKRVLFFLLLTRRIFLFTVLHIGLMLISKTFFFF